MSKCMQIVKCVAQGDEPILGEIKTSEGGRCMEGVRCNAHESIVGETKFDEMCTISKNIALDSFESIGTQIESCEMRNLVQIEFVCFAET